MAQTWKPIVFTAVVITAFTIILFLFVHRSNQRRLCENPKHLFYTDKSTGNSSCFLKHTKGLCAPNMILYPKPLNDSVGVCDCDLIHNNRGLVYDNQTEQCHFIFSQGYCSPNQWLKPYKCSENLCVRCERNPCASFSSSSDDSTEWVQLKDGSCAELGRNHRSCKTSHENDVIHFSKMHVFPSCETLKPPPTFDLDLGGIGVPPSKCPQGYAKTATGHCAPPFEF